MSIIASSARHRAHSGAPDMGASSRVQEKDEELGRRSEDYWRHSRSRSQAMNGTLPWRKRRLLLGIALFLAIYVLFRNIPIDLRPSLPNMYPRRSSDGGSSAGQPVGPPPKIPEGESNAAAKHYYDGIIQFYNLAGSLEDARKVFGYYGRSRNVLFAASSLQSVAKLVPIACEMQRRERNKVHLALFGRDTVPLEELKELNGVDQESCDMFWHDARPDYAEYSTELRAETGATFALKSFREYISPQVLITDDLEEEDAFFKRSVTTDAKRFQGPLIQIPKGSEEKLEWVARLDIESLKKWDDMSVDILIHAEPRSIGSLQRLVRSLETADFQGLGYPRLIVEVAPDADGALLSFVEALQWPPTTADPLNPVDLLTVRRRVNGKTLSAEEASIRFMESFYPNHVTDAHVLILSSNAEVSPLFYHFVKYNILEYRYGPEHEARRNELLGFSLVLPTTLLDATTELHAPTTGGLNSLNKYKSKPGEPDQPVPFLWEAPNSGAAVYFGDKWLELQSFVTHRIDRRIKHSPKQKEISTKFPAWMEYFMELMHARGYFMLYTQMQNEQRLVALHDDSAHIPEEFESSAAATNGQDSDTSKSDDTFIAPPRTVEEVTAHRTGGELVSAVQTALHQVLPLDGLLPALSDLIALATPGGPIGRNTFIAGATKYTAKFRQVIGGCDADNLYQKMLKEGRDRVVFSFSAKDLFCFGDEDEEKNYEAAESSVPDYSYGMPDEGSVDSEVEDGDEEEEQEEDEDAEEDTSDGPQPKSGKSSVKDTEGDDGQAEGDRAGGTELKLNAKALKHLNALQQDINEKKLPHVAEPVVPAKQAAKEVR